MQPQWQPIPLSVPNLSGNEWTYIKECLDTNWVSSAGKFVDRFEETVAEYIGAKSAVATSSGTAALHVALLVAGIKPDDEVLVSSLTFVAPANAIRYVGAWPVFMDADPVFWQMDPQKVIDFLEQECRWADSKLINKNTGRRVTAILPVHVLGHPCDMSPILEVAAKYDLRVIEDASESLGATYKGQMTGHLGDIACFSFNGNKIITTGGGGMIVTDNEEWADRARYLTTQAKDDPIEYFHNEIGYNYRLTNLLAAMGVAQMEQLPGFVEDKRRIAGQYQTAFQDLEGLALMPHGSDVEPTYWLYTVLLQQATSVEDRKALVQKLNEMGVGSRPIWHPLDGLPPFAECQAFRIENSYDIYRRGVSLPCSTDLSTDQQQRAIAAFIDLVVK
jgi:perosamine synthetase